ncbi:phosphatase PAP2 family protein [Clostridium tunisiense]|uniref:phosphatase PAP2 family protein n=1 Tax=Clostridium tunisiense TaxID=219748 RepID=UPI0002D9EB3F|nr:phosphatase PAP2 family protein [Clostridium tunisiense]
MEFLHSIDKSIVDFVHYGLQNSLFDFLMPKITALGEAGIIWIVISLILIATKKHRKTGITCLVALFLSLLFTDLSIKQIVQRPRPITAYPIENSLIKIPTSYSFPSGHTSSSFAAAWVLYRIMDKYKLCYLALAGIMAFSRMYLYVHYLSDVVGGIVVGIISATLAMIIVNKYVKRRNQL